MTSQIDPESLLRQLSDGVLVCRKDGELLYSNPAFARALGYSDEEIKKKNVGKDLVGRNLEWQALVSLLEQGGVCEDYEIKFRRADGGISCCSISASNLRDPGGALIGLAIVFRDITTRKGMENDLKEKAYRIDIMNKIAKLTSADNEFRSRSLVSAAAELRKLVDFTTLTVGLTEEKGRHVEVSTPDLESPDFTRTLGSVLFDGSIVQTLKMSKSVVLIDKDAAQKPFTEISVIDMSKVQSMLCVPLSSRGHIIGSLNLGHSKPNQYDLESADILQMVADQVAGLIDNIVLLRSLEARVKLHEALAKSGVEIQKAINTEQIYAAIAENLREVVRYKELSFYLVDWSSGMVRPVYAISKFAKEVMASSGTLDEGVVGSVARSGKAEFTDDVDADPRVSQVPGVPLEHDSMLALPLFGSEGVIGVLELYRTKGDVFTVTDLEAGKLFAQQAAVALANAQLISKLQEAKKEIEMLNDLMFHDINNFNFATLNYIQMTIGNPDISPESRAHLEKSLHLIKQTADLIEGVKKLTKIDFMTTKDFVDVDLVGALNRVIAGIENSFPSKSVSVNVRTPPMALIFANKLVDEIFINLLTNAAKYDPHAEVEVDVECEKVLEDGKAFWRVSVADHGVGVPDDKKELLFKKYLRLMPEAKVSGTGLGLSICKALVDKFEGRIWVEDRVPGKSELGAKFVVALPVAKSGSRGV
jgi:PAS domain S-box-containing protein